MNDDSLDSWGERIFQKVIAGNYGMRLYYRFLEGLHVRTQQNKDAVVAVCGERGLGKSSFAILSSILLRRIGLSYSFSNNFYGSEKTKEVLTEIVNSEKTVYNFDEVINYGYSRNATTRINKRFANIFTMARKLNNVYFYCIPKFRKLDSDLRNDIVHYWIEIFWQSNTKDHHKKYAHAVIFRKDKNPISLDPWGFEEMRAYKYKKVFTHEAQQRILKKMRSYVCTISFPALPLKLEEEYEQLSKDALRKTMSSIKEEKTNIY